MDSPPGIFPIDEWDGPFGDSLRATIELRKPGGLGICFAFLMKALQQRLRELGSLARGKGPKGAATRVWGGAGTAPDQSRVGELVVGSRFDCSHSGSILAA
ncbi:MAG TPA: hypothetical protein VF881_16105 [Polyangiaceae bacterium]